MYCLSCGAENNESANFCQNCGATRDLFRVTPSTGTEDITSVSQRYRNEPSSSHTLPILIGVISVVAIIAVGAAVYFYRESEIAGLRATNQKNGQFITTPIATSSVQQTPLQRNTPDKSQEVKQEEVANQEKEKLQKEKDAQEIENNRSLKMEDLKLQMKQRAEREALGRHSGSNSQGCTLASSETVTKTDEKEVFSVVFDCRLIGKYLGVKLSKVVVKVRGEITAQGKNFLTNVVEPPEVISDGKP